MMELSASGDLRLTAIYGLVIAIAVILSGAAIGRWIDNTKRLTGLLFVISYQVRELEEQSI